MAQSVYRYASNIVQIICKKKYSRYFSNPPDFSYAMTKDRTYFLAEYSSPETIIFVHKVGSDIVKLVSGGITKNFRIDQLLHSSYSAQDS